MSIDAVHQLKGAARAEKFLLTLAVTVVTLSAAFALIVAVIDPYGLFNAPAIAGVNKIKPKVGLHERVLKFYQVRYQQPSAIVLGSSRATVGLRAATLARYAGKAYNLGFNAGNVQENEIAFQYAVRVAPIKTAVLEVHMKSFADMPDGDVAMLRRRAGGGWRIELTDFAKYTVSLQAVGDAFETVSNNILGLPASHSADGMYVNYVPGPLKDDKTIVRYKPFPEAGFAAFSRICELAQAHHIDLKIVLSPVYFAYGYDPDFRAAWADRLKAIAKQYGFAVFDPTLEWDVINDRANFLDLSHYKPELGDRILGALFAGKDTPRTQLWRSDSRG